MIVTGCGPPRKRATSSGGETVGGQADALRRPPQEVIEALQGHGQVRAALGTSEGVDLVDDDRLHRPQRLPHGAGEHEIERLRRCDEDAGRVVAQPTTLPRGVSPTRTPPRSGGWADGADSRQRPAQVALHVRSQRLERGDVEDPHAVGLSPGTPSCRLGPLFLRGRLPPQAVDGGQEGRERLARAGRGDDQGVLTPADRGPCPLLHRGGAGGEGVEEPGAGGRGESLPARLVRTRGGGRVPAASVTAITSSRLVSPTILPRGCDSNSGV